jgi:hypothetical protein
MSAVAEDSGSRQSQAETIGLRLKAVTKAVSDAWGTFDCLGVTLDSTTLPPPHNTAILDLLVASMGYVHSFALVSSSSSS